MSFTDDFQSCMNGKGLPTPVQVVDTVEDAITFITQLWKNLSTNEQLTLAGLAALGVAAGIDEEVLAVLAQAGNVALRAYLSACSFCLFSAGGSTARARVASSDIPSDLQNGLLAQADAQGVTDDPNAEANA